MLHYIGLKHWLLKMHNGLILLNNFLLMKNKSCKIWLTVKVLHKILEDIINLIPLKLKLV